ncbi:MAG: helix-turn-helix domain-containing protein [Gorillibacterium sp.]|nr:helix-turn-helix domain-containing protein [Gorillibacterium sp.]
MDNKHRTEPVTITAEQSKLLHSALRIRILRVLEDEARTSKQVADLLQKTPGNVHYHIQKLYDGGLLKLVGTQIVGGVVEKYYRSIGSMFRAADFPEYQFIQDKSKNRFATRLYLSDAERVELLAEFDDLLSRWENRQTSGDEYGISITLGRVHEESSS